MAELLPPASAWVETNQQGWERLFAHLPLAEQLQRLGHASLAADTIKRVSGREPRLMCKFDSAQQRPPPLRKVGLWPVRNGDYTLVQQSPPLSSYLTIGPPHSPLLHHACPDAVRQLSTLSLDLPPRSESQVLDMALHTGMLARFLNEPQLFLTVRGRLRAPAFAFACPSDHGPVPLAVDGVQVEVDAGLEGQGLYLVEAKMGAWRDVHLRQLYYPYRMWRLLAPNKPVFAVYCGYSNQVFQLRAYRFVDDELAGLTCVAAQDYTLSELQAWPTRAQALLPTPAPLEVPSAPFPQADQLEQVMAMVDAAAAGWIDGDSLCERFGFVPRQADYYRQAAVFMGWLSKGGDAGFVLTREGAALSRLQHQARWERVLHTLQQRPVFAAVLARWAEHQTCSSAELGVLLQQTYPDYAPSTIERRASTALAWLETLSQQWPAQSSLF